MRTLLLADASPMMQRIVELTFAQEDIRVTAVRDGEDAARQIAAEPPDIVLVDHALPKRSGYEVTALVKGRAELAHIPVLLLSGAFEPVDRVRAAQVGCDGVVSKPFEPPQLVARVRELLARPQPRPALVVPGGTGAGGAAERVDVPTISALLGTSTRDEPVDTSGSHDPVPGEPTVEAPEEAATGPAHATHLTDLSELAEALGAFSRRTPERGTVAPPPPAEPPAAADTEELVEEITRRVLERMAPDAIHTVLSRTVSHIAGQLLREELERRRSAAMPAEGRAAERA